MTKETSPERILIADDDPIAREVLRTMLDRWNFEVCEAGTGREAWELLTAPDAAPLALLDWVMPEMTGPELCRKLKANQTHALPYLILLTSKAEPKDIVEGLNAGADDFVVKPYQFEELRARIDVGRRMIRLHGELVKLNEALEQRVRERTREVERLLHEKNELLQHLGHDLKTPLTPLIALLPLLLEAESNPERREMLQLANEGVRGIHALVARVFELCAVAGPRQMLACNRTDLRELVGTLLNAPATGRQLQGRTLASQIPDGLFVRVNSGLMRRAIGNVLDNALRFTAPGGGIEVRASRAEGGVKLQVCDDGIGIAADHLDRIFDAFYKVDGSRHDRTVLGLGLTIARAIVECHGGKIGPKAPASSAEPRSASPFRKTFGNITGKMNYDADHDCGRRSAHSRHR